MQKKTNLSKEEVKKIQSRMNELKKKNTDNKSSTQALIPFTEMFRDGVCWIRENIFSQTIEFFDTDYELADFESRSNLFSKWCSLHNFFDDSIDFQFTYEPQYKDVNSLLKQIKAEIDQDSDIGKEYSEIICGKLEKQSNVTLRRFLTFSVHEKSLAAARQRLASISAEVIRIFDEMNVRADVLNGEQRLESLYRSLHPFSKEPFLFDWNLKQRAGYSTKDFVAPSSMKIKKANFELGDCFGSITTINILAGELSDRMLMEFLNSVPNLSINIHLKSFDQLRALKLVRGKLTDVEKMKIDEQKKASMSGYDSDILPPSIKLYLEELEELLADLNSRNERLFTITLTVRSYAETEKKAKLQTETIKRLVQKNSCQLQKLEYLQEQAFASFLPLGINDVPVTRTGLPTSAVAVFVPYSIPELFKPSGAYYGVNPVSKNIILGDRTKLKNPNGLIFGTPGSGKSFSVKREITDRFFRTTADIMIIDPEGEYFPLVSHLGGQVVKISSNSTQYINPMDVNIDTDSIEDIISTKSDFISSLCELVIGGRYGITGEERSAIDLSTRNIYNRFFNDSPSPKKMPTLADLFEELKRQGEVTQRVYNSLDMYVNGSQNLFSHQTNMNIENRIVCFDIKELGTQLKKIAMLILQDQVWNRVSLNRDINKSTFYYVDEFHLLLRDEQTAKYAVEMWKRFRKWGGIPTGITQNVKDLLTSPEIENILDNSDFVYMLNQAAGDREILQEKLHISDEQIHYVTNSGQGKGLIRYGKVILPFEDEFPKSTVMYSLLTTKPGETKKLTPKAEKRQ